MDVNGDPPTLKRVPREISKSQLRKIMEQIRMRVDDVVKDPKTAAALKPYYPFGCKRPGN